MSAPKWHFVASNLGQNEVNERLSAMVSFNSDSAPLTSKVAAQVAAVTEELERLNPDADWMVETNVLGALRITVFAGSTPVKFWTPE